MFPFQTKRNIFAPPEEDDPENDDGEEGTPLAQAMKTEPTTTQPSTDPRYTTDINNIINNPGPSTAAYKKLVTQVPQASDVHPSKLTRTAAILSGLGAGVRDPEAGARTAEGVIRAPYEKMMTDYKEKLAATGQAANLEREDAQMQLQAASQARAMGLKYDQFHESQLKNQNQNTIEQEKLKISKARADAYIKNLGDPDYDYTPQTDGSLLAVNKHDPKDTHTIKADTVAAATLKTRQRANDIAGRRVAIDEANSKSLSTYRQVMGDAATKRANTSADRLNKPVTPYQQAKSVDLALSLMYRDKRWAKFIKQGDATSPEPYLAAQDDGSPMYQAFKKELKRQVENQIKNGSPFADESDQGDDDVSLEGISK